MQSSGVLPYRVAAWVSLRCPGMVLSSSARRILNEVRVLRACDGECVFTHRTTDTVRTVAADPESGIVCFVEHPCRRARVPVGWGHTAVPGYCVIFCSMTPALMVRC